MPTDVEQTSVSTRRAGNAGERVGGKPTSDLPDTQCDTEEMTRPAARDMFAMTLQEIASELGVSREYVGQLERAAIKKIRARLAARGWHAGMFDWR